VTERRVTFSIVERSRYVAQIHIFTRHISWNLMNCFAQIIQMIMETFSFRELMSTCSGSTMTSLLDSSELSTTPNPTALALQGLLLSLCIPTRLPGPSPEARRHRGQHTRNTRQGAKTALLPTSCKLYNLP